MGNFLEICYTTNQGKDSYIKKLNKNEYMLKSTGEIKKYNYNQNREQNIFSIYQSVKKLRRLISTNFVGGENELWITLTFGKNKIYNPKDLCPIFEKFIKRLRYKYKNQKIDYIYIPEPHEKGDWHIHLLLKSNFDLYIPNKLLQEIWSHGFVKVNRLENVENIGLYVSAYLTNIKDGEQTKKGARLYLYPPGHQLFRCSSGIKKPIETLETYKQAKEKAGVLGQPTFQKTLKISDNVNFLCLTHIECYKKL
ncbi:MAG: replicative protein [Clostridia bacterium]|nr:replicative protein [Clostridia bacterium]